MKSILFFVSLCLPILFAVADDVKEQPPAPPLEVPELADISPAILCIDCDEPFDTTTHKRVLAELVDNPYLKQLRLALYKQDILHQFESKAHFDNCDFDSSIKYINLLLEDVGNHVSKTLKARAEDRPADADAAIEDAFFSLGQALHGVQDFYAHTNYIELVAPHASKVTDIKLVLHWKDSGRNHIAALREAGLVSGVVWWGLPKKCPSGTETHSDLAKDNAKTDSGKIRIANLRNITQYQIAEFLARETSLKLMEHAYDTWPILREASGDHVAFETMVDRRKENF